MTRREVEARVGSARDLFGPRLLTVASGPECGSRFASLRSAAGLELSINLDRGMDARDAWWRGMPISFHASFTHSSSPAAEAGWLRSWPGGLLTTCGLRNVGPADSHGGEHHGQHGRFFSLSARDVCIGGEWEGDSFVSRVSGTLLEACTYGEHLECSRTWTLRSDSSLVELSDVVTNVGFRTEHVLLLYHVNVGWPLLGEGARLELPGPARPLGGGPAVDDEELRRVGPPAANGTEQVYVHDLLAPDSDGWTSARVVSPASTATVLSVSWRSEELPHLIVWRSFVAGAYALGIEPANCYPRGRAAEIEDGRAAIFEPGETKRYNLRLELRPA